MDLIASVRNWWSGLSAHRPEVLMGARGALDGQKSVYLIVRNRSRFPVRIRAIEIEPKFIAVLGGPESRTAFKALADVSFSATIAAESEREFPIVILAFNEKDRRVPVSVRVDWRSNRRPDAQLPPVNYRTSIEAIRSMLDA